MSAKAKFVVRISVGIGHWQGEWDGKEEQYETQSTVLTETTSRKFAEQFYKNRGGKLSPLFAAKVHGKPSRAEIKEGK